MAYNGLASYDVVLVGIQTFLSNFAGPILWSLLAAVSARHFGSKGKPGNSFFLYASAFRSVALLAYSISATVFRDHLFTWTVFSPAVLYKIVWTVLMHWAVDGLVAWLFY
jgi:ethanolaminephosphotransferase